MTLFGPFADVPYYPVVFPLFWGAVVVFLLAMARHLRVFAAVRAEGPSPFADIPRRRLALRAAALSVAAGVRGFSSHRCSCNYAPIRKIC
jgi:hypothetical protein